MPTTDPNGKPAARAVATIPLAPANCNSTPFRFIDSETTPRIAQIIAELASVAAMNCPDKYARQCFLGSAAQAFDGMAALERAQARKTGGAA